jgi:lipopolysaccharide export system protein LptC
VNLTYLGMNRVNATSAQEDMDARNPYGVGRSNDDRQFRAAVRHSRGVRLLRRAIPVTLVLIFALIIVATWFNPIRMLAKLPIDPGKLLISGTKITMEAPRLAGFTRDARPYEFTARAAAQDLTKPDVLELKDIHAKIEMQDKAQFELTATNGLYDTKADQMRLVDNIQIASSSGYSGRLSEALVDVKKGNVVSERPVEVIMLNGTLNANRMEVVNNGELIRFDGGVSMNLILNSDTTEQKASDQ